MTTFAYWLCAIEKNANLPALHDLATAMATQCDIEEQRHDPEFLLEIHSLSPSPLKPLAPVTLADRWTPFPSACDILGPAKTSDSTADQHRAYAYGIWSTKWLGGLDVHNLSVDESHFRYLLRLVCAKADSLDRELFILGQIGWSYEIENPMNPEVALAMLECGYVYTDRVQR